MLTLYNQGCIAVNNFRCLNIYNMGCTLTPMSALSERLRIARKRAVLTQAQLAEKSGVKQQMISKLETGRSQETADIVPLAIAMQVRPEWLSTGKEPMTEHSFVGNSDQNEFLDAFFNQLKNVLQGATHTQLDQCLRHFQQALQAIGFSGVEWIDSASHGTDDANVSKRIRGGATRRQLPHKTTDVLGANQKRSK